MGDRGQAARRALEGVLAAEDRSQMLISSIKDYAIFMLSPDGNVESWNTGAQRIKGYTSDEIIGKHFSIFYPPEDVASGKCEAELLGAEADGRFEDEGWRLRKDGSRFWANVVITAVRDGYGELVGFAKVTRDLTERRSAEEALRMSESRLRMLVGSVKDYAIFTLDRDGNVTTWNVGAERIKGYTAAEIMGQSFTYFYTAEDVASGKPQRELEIAANEGRFEEEDWRVRKDGSKFWASIVVSAMRDETGHLIGYAKITRDLTERRMAEKERARLVQAQETIRLRDEFLSIASHELRTPLTAIRLELSALARRLADTDTRTAAKLARLNRGSDRLVSLVEALLDVSRISTGQLVLTAERVDLVKIVHDAVDQLREAARRANCPITVTIADDATQLVGTWDPLRLGQVITNLIGNAIKYAASAPIDITVRREDGNAVMVVDDHGRGLAPGDLDRIFGRFERAAPSTHFGGLGLGLYVARQIINGHDGTIRATNRASGGASFVVTLPLAGESPKTS